MYKIVNENKYVPQQHATTSTLHASEFGQTHTELRS